METAFLGYYNARYATIRRMINPPKTPLKIETRSASRFFN